MILLGWLGIRNRGIATILGISEHTVRNYWQNAFERLAIRGECGSPRARAALEKLVAVLDGDGKR